MWLSHAGSAGVYQPLDGEDRGSRYLLNGKIQKNWSSTKVNLPGRCPVGLEKDGELCYPKCKDGYDGVGPVCWKYCPSDYIDDGALCRRDRTFIKGSYGRGAGIISLPSCPAGMVNDAGLCYKPCKDGYYGVGPVCWQSCPDYLTDTGTMCQDNVHVFAKDSYGRTAGKPIIISYYEPEYDEDACANNQWTGMSYGEHGQEFVVYRNMEEKVSIFAFRGSETTSVDGMIEDWFGANTDFTPHNITYAGIDVWVHSGFWRNANKVLPHVEKELITTPHDHKIIFTGHSLGAAVATISAVEVANKGLRNIYMVTTFGSPMAGDGHFKKAYEKLVGCHKTTRAAVEEDVITQIPEVYGYTHVCPPLSFSITDITDPFSLHDMFEGYDRLVNAMVGNQAEKGNAHCPKPMNSPTANQHCISLYEDAYFGGKLIQVCEDTPTLGGFNDKLSSYVLPEPVAVKFYEGENYTGGFYTRVWNDVIDGHNVAFYDKIKSIQFIEMKNCITLYENGHFQGEQEQVCGDTPVLGNFKNRMTSYSLPDGVSVRFYEEENYKGGYYTRHWNDQGDRELVAFNDKTQSIKFIK